MQIEKIEQQLLDGIKERLGFRDEDVSLDTFIDPDSKKSHWLYFAIYNMCDSLNIPIKPCSRKVDTIRKAARYILGDDTLAPEPDENVIIFAVVQSEEGEAQIAVGSQWHWQVEHCLPDHWSEFRDPARLEAIMSELNMYEAVESIFELPRGMGLEETITRLQEAGLVRNMDFEGWLAH